MTLPQLLIGFLILLLVCFHANYVQMGMGLIMVLASIAIPVHCPLIICYGILSMGHRVLVDVSVHAHHPLI